MDKKVINSKECADYILYSEKIGKYYRTKGAIPLSLETKYKIALERYRTLLDNLGYKMPKRNFMLCFN